MGLDAVTGLLYVGCCCCRPHTPRYHASQSNRSILLPPTSPATLHNNNTTSIVSTLVRAMSHTAPPPPDIVETITHYYVPLFRIRRMMEYTYITNIYRCSPLKRKIRVPRNSPTAERNISYDINLAIGDLLSLPSAASLLSQVKPSSHLRS